MSTEERRSTEFLRIAFSNSKGLQTDQTRVIHVRNVECVYQDGQSRYEGLYDVKIKGSGYLVDGFATEEDLLACGIPLPDSPEYLDQLGTHIWLRSAMDQKNAALP